MTQSNPIFLRSPGQICALRNVLCLELCLEALSVQSLFSCVCTVGLEHGAPLPARTRHSCRKKLICGPGKIPCAGGSDWKRGCPQAAPARGRVAENPWGEWSCWWSFVNLELPWSFEERSRGFCWNDKFLFGGTLVKKFLWEFHLFFKFLFFPPYNFILEKVFALGWFLPGACPCQSSYQIEVMLLKLDISRVLQFSMGEMWLF